MPFCAHWWLILSHVLPPKRTVYFPAWCFVSVEMGATYFLLRTWLQRSKQRTSSPTQVRAAAGTALPWASALSSTECFLKHSSLSTTQLSSTEHFRPPAKAWNMSQLASSEHQNGSDQATSQMNLYSVFLKVTDPKQGHTKLPIRWASSNQMSSALAAKFYSWITSVSLHVLHFSKWNAEQLALLFMPDCCDNAALVAHSPS